MSVVEEVLNSVLHGIGLLLAVAALVLLVVWASFSHNAWAITSMSIFGSALVLLYLASILCHSLSRTKAARVMGYIDYSAIYVLIAGTYTPFALITLRGPLGWTLFGIEWGLAVLGIVVSIVLLKRGSVLLYLLMGWLIVIAIVPLWQNASPSVIWWLVAGGISYSAGVIFYRSEKEFMHIIWHLSVILGSVCHFFAVAGILPK